MRAGAWAFGTASAFVGSALALAGCREAAGPDPSFSQHRAVYAVVQVGSSDVRVVAEELLDNGGRGPLEGAQGVVTGAFGSVPLTEAAAGPTPCFATSGGATSGEAGCYTAALPQPVTGGEAITLELEAPDGGEVRGELRTPAPPVASFPPDSQRVSSAYFFTPDGLPIVIVPVGLEAAPGAARVDAVATVVGAWAFRGNGAPLDPTKCGVEAGIEPLETPPFEGEHDFNLYGVTCMEDGSQVFWDSLDLEVRVVSMEENYAEYFDRVLGSSATDVTRASFGIDGAVGVFGAVATTVLRLRVWLDCSIVIGCL